MPSPPNVEIRRNPIEEQLAQALEVIPKIEPENKDLSNLIFAFLTTYTFIATNIPINTEVIFVIMNPDTASSGK
jgi:hypothetical protein